MIDAFGCARAGYTNAERICGAETGFHDRLRMLQPIFGVEPFAVWQLNHHKAHQALLENQHSGGDIRMIATAQVTLLCQMGLFDWIYRITRWGLGGIFIYAGSMKLLAPETFAVLIEAFGIVPENLLMPVAIALPAIEVAAGIGLVFDIEGSLAATAGLLGLFIAILGYGIWMGLDIDCGCFGPDDPEAEAFHGLRLSLYRDLVMLAGAAFVYGWRRYRPVEPRKIIRLIDRKRRAKDACV